MSDEQFRRICLEILAISSPDKSAQIGLIHPSEGERLNMITRIAKKALTK